MKLTENASFKTDKYIDLGAWIKIKQEFDTLFETACKNAHNWKTMASSFIVDASRKLKVVYKFEPRAQSMFKTHRMEPSYKFNWFLAVRIHTEARIYLMNVSKKSNDFNTSLVVFGTQIALKAASGVLPVMLLILNLKVSILFCSVFFLLHTLKIQE